MKRCRLRDAREQAGWTQAALAARVGKRQDYIAKLETGAVQEPAFSVGLRLARVLDVDPYALRFGSEKAGGSL